MINPDRGLKSQRFEVPVSTVEVGRGERPQECIHYGSTTVLLDTRESTQETVITIEHHGRYDFTNPAAHRTT